jgi:hypothetical protein
MASAISSGSIDQKCLYQTELVALTVGSPAMSKLSFEP